ncbi:AAA-like domain-containing protein, partial [bacterium]|nr:AAA-like domain-containing protein [bacterium]
MQRIELENQAHPDLTLIPVNISLQETTPRNRRAFFNALIRKLVRCLNTRHDIEISAEASNLPFVREDDFDLEVVSRLLLDIIETSMVTVGYVRIVFLIDEIEYLMNEPFADELIVNLRHLISNNPIRENISFVLFGDKYLYEIADIKGSPLENVIKTLQLGAFNEQESLGLIHTLTENRLEQKLVHGVVRLSNGHPCIIQHLMWRLAQSDIAQIKEADLHNACSDFLQKSLIFHHWLKHFNDLDKRVYFAFAKHREREFVDYSYSNLHSMFSNESLPDCLEKLFYYGLLHKPGASNYRAILGLFAEQFRTRFSETAENLTFNLDLDVYK